MVAPVSANRAPQGTRMPNGVTNARSYQTMANAPLLDPTFTHIYSNDFDAYNANDWSLTGTGTPAAALVAGNGGILQLSTSAGATDSIVLQDNPTSFALTPGKQFFFKWSGQLSVVNGNFYVGIANAGAGAETAITNGIVIYKAAAGNTLVLDVIVGGVHNPIPFPAACVITPGTFVELGIMIDMTGNVLAFWNPTTGKNANPPGGGPGVPGTAIPRGAVAVAAQPSLPASTVLMAGVISYANGSAAASTVLNDYIVVCVER